MSQYYVYILSHRPYNTFYIGVTNDLVKRIWQHKFSGAKGFTKKYQINRLVYFETYEDILLAIEQEKRLKKWPRQWKINLIIKNNPLWKDLYMEIIH